METDLLKTLGQIAGIGGISLGVLLLVFRDIIRKNIFPKFKDEQLAFRLLRLMVFLVWSIAVIGISAWVYTTISGHNISETISISSTKFSGDMHLTNINVILNQYSQIHDGQLTDKELIRKIERGTNLVKSGNYEEAIPIFKQVAEKYQLPVVYNNLGVLYAVTEDLSKAREALTKSVDKNPEDQIVQLNFGLLEERLGNINKAKRHFEKAPDLKEARQVARRIENEIEGGLIELEPNNDIKSSNIIPLDKWVRAIIKSGSDFDYFTFTTPEQYRDIVKIDIQNKSTTLKPYLALYGSNKKKIWDHDAYWMTPGQNQEHSFVAAPNSVYYIAVGSHATSEGPYQVKATPLKAYDAYEPNNDIRNAKPFQIGESLKANIMDGSDTDYYSVKTSPNHSSILVSIENESTTLKPYLAFFDANKKKLWDHDAYWMTPGQNQQQSFTVEPNSVYYIAVGGHTTSYGAYRLSSTIEGRSQ